MITLSTLNVAEPRPDTFSLFKQDASIPDEYRDALLRSKLRAAMMRVQGVSGTSLLPSTLELCVSEREENFPVRLYQRAKEILSVTDGKGEALEYVRDGAIILPGRFTSSVIVTYETEPVLDDILDLQEVVSRLAVALYDNETPEVINRILMEAQR